MIAYIIIFIALILVTVLAAGKRNNWKYQAAFYCLLSIVWLFIGVTHIVRYDSTFNRVIIVLNFLLFILYLARGIYWWVKKKDWWSKD